MSVKPFRPAVPLLAAFLMAGCASSPISKDLRREARKDLTFERASRDPDAYKGALVIWGGYIVEVTNTPGYTEFVVLDAPLEDGDEPGPSDSSKGRFLARINKFLDPAVYRKGRKVTVAGKITGSETRDLGGTSYRYTVLDTEEMHMWERERPFYPYEPMLDFGFWYGPAFYPEFELYHEHHHH